MLHTYNGKDQSYTYTYLYLLTTTAHIIPSDAVYLPGKTNVQLTAFDRQVVNDQTSQDYVVTIDKVWKSNSFLWLFIHDFTLLMYTHIHVTSFSPFE